MLQARILFIVAYASGQSSLVLSMLRTNAPGAAWVALFTTTAAAAGLAAT